MVWRKAEGMGCARPGCRHPVLFLQCLGDANSPGLLLPLTPNIATPVSPRHGRCPSPDGNSGLVLTRRFQQQDVACRSRRKSSPSFVGETETVCWPETTLRVAASCGWDYASKASS